MHAGQENATQDASISDTHIRNNDDVMLIHDKSFFLSVNDANDGVVLRETKFKHTSHVQFEDRAGQFKICICSMPFDKKHFKSKQQAAQHGDYSVLKARQHLSMAKRKAERKRRAIQLLLRENDSFAVERNVSTTTNECVRWTTFPSNARSRITQALANDGSARLGSPKNNHTKGPPPPGIEQIPIELAIQAALAANAAQKQGTTPGQLRKRTTFSL
jgi:hypothetical protein